MSEIVMKTCSRCGETKPLEEFVKDNRRKDGHATICKECRRKKDRERYQQLKEDEAFMEKHREHGRKYKERHKDKVDAYNAEYRMRPEVCEHKREWHQNRQQTLSLEKLFKDMVHRCKTRAREKGFPCTITWKDLESLYVENCPLLEIPLNWSSCSEGRNEYTPSVDKIVPELGYVPGNIRIISNLANMMKSYANKEQLLTFAKNIKNYMNCEEIVQPIENKESIELEDKEPLG